MQNYEYKIITTSSTTEQLNEWGSEGWDLVSVVVDDYTRCYYFKRPIVDRCLQCDSSLSKPKRKYCTDKCQRSSRNVSEKIIK